MDTEEAGESISDDDLPLVFHKRVTRSQAGEIVAGLGAVNSTYLYHPPRVDAVLYQAEVPPFKAPKKGKRKTESRAARLRRNGKQLPVPVLEQDTAPKRRRKAPSRSLPLLRDELVWCPPQQDVNYTSTEDVERFLAFARTLAPSIRVELKSTPASTPPKKKKKKKKDTIRIHNLSSESSSSESESESAEEDGEESAPADSLEEDPIPPSKDRSRSRSSSMEGDGMLLEEEEEEEGEDLEVEDADALKIVGTSLLPPDGHTPPVTLEMVQRLKSMDTTAAQPIDEKEAADGKEEKSIFDSFHKPFCIRVPFTAKPPSVAPAESDEKALEILHHCNYDVERAQLLLSACSGVGLEEDRFEEDVWSEEEEESDTRKIVVEQSTLSTLRAGEKSRQRKMMLEQPAVVVGDTDREKASSGSSEDDDTLRGRSVRLQDKSRMTERWKDWSRQVNALLNKVEPFASRQELQEKYDVIHGLLLEKEDVEKACSSSFFLSVNSATRKLLRRLNVGRLWAAKVRDFIFSCQRAQTMQCRQEKEEEWLTQLTAASKPFKEGKREALPLPCIDPLPTISALIAEGKKIQLEMPELSALRRWEYTIEDWRDKAMDLIEACEASARRRATDATAAGGDKRRRKPGSGPSSKVKPVNRCKMEKLLKSGMLLPVRSPLVFELKERLNKVNMLEVEARRMLLIKKRNDPKIDFAALCDLQQRAIRGGVGIPLFDVVDALISEVNDWIGRSSNALQQNVDLKILNQLLHEGGHLRVDVSEHLENLKSKVAKAREWLGKVQSLVPRPGSKKTRRVNVQDEKMELVEVEVLLSEANGVSMPGEQMEQLSDVVELAKDWIQTVRESLQKGTGADLNALKELLDQADGIPVAMEEEQLLRTEVESRLWLFSAKELLALARARRSEAKAESERAPEVDEVKEMARLLRDLVDIKSMASSELKKRVGWQLPKEVEEIRGEFERVDLWLKRFKKCRNRRSPMKKLQDLIAEAPELPLNVDSQVETLKAIIKEGENFVAFHKVPLDAVAFAVNNWAVEEGENGENMNAEDSPIEEVWAALAEDVEDIIRVRQKHVIDLLPVLEKKPKIKPVVVADGDAMDVEGPSVIEPPVAPAVSDAVINEGPPVDSEEQNVVAPTEEGEKGDDAMEVVAPTAVEEAKPKVEEEEEEEEEIVGWVYSAKPEDREDLCFSDQILKNIDTEETKLPLFVAEVKEVRSIAKMVKLWRKEATALLNLINSRDALLASGEIGFSDGDLKRGSNRYVQRRARIGLESEAGMFAGDNSQSEDPDEEEEEEGVKDPEPPVQEVAGVRRTGRNRRKKRQTGSETPTGKKAGKKRGQKRKSRVAKKKKKKQRPVDPRPMVSELCRVIRRGRNLPVDLRGELGLLIEEFRSVNEWRNRCRAVLRGIVPSSTGGSLLDPLSIASAAEVQQTLTTEISRLLEEGRRQIVRTEELSVLVNRQHAEEWSTRVLELLGSVTSSSKKDPPATRSGGGRPTRRGRKKMAFKLQFWEAMVKEGLQFANASAGRTIAGLPELQKFVAKVHALSSDIESIVECNVGGAACALLMQLQSQTISVDRAQTLLAEASTLPVVIPQVAELEQILDRTLKLMGEVKHATSKRPTDSMSSKLKTLPELMMLNEKLSSLNVVTAEGSELMETIRAAQQWLNAVRDSGIDRGVASIADLQALITAAERIPVDLSSHVQLLKQAIQPYCICHQPHSEMMVGCIKCRQWFHAKCIGVSRQYLSVTRQPYTCAACGVKDLLRGLVLNARRSLRLVLVVLQQAQAHGKGVEQPPQPPTAQMEEAEKSALTQMPFKPTVMQLIRELYALLYAPTLVELHRVREKSKLLSMVKRYKEEGLDEDEVSRVVFAVPKMLLCLPEVLECFLTPSTVPGLQAALETLKDVPVTEGTIYDSLLSAFNRATSWSESVTEYLLLQGPVNVKIASTLLEMSRYIPVQLPTELLTGLSAVVSDGGNPYCICRGLNTGTKMIGCDKCPDWFHIDCMGVSPEECDSLQAFLCPNCAEGGYSRVICACWRRVALVTFSGKRQTVRPADDGKSLKSGLGFPLPEERYGQIGMFGQTGGVDASSSRIGRSDSLNTLLLWETGPDPRRQAAMYESCVCVGDPWSSRRMTTARAVEEGMPCTGPTKKGASKARQTKNSSRAAKAVAVKSKAEASSARGKRSEERALVTKTAASSRVKRKRPSQRGSPPPTAVEAPAEGDPASAPPPAKKARVEEVAVADGMHAPVPDQVMEEEEEVKEPPVQQEEAVEPSAPAEADDAMDVVKEGLSTPPDPVPPVAPVVEATDSAE